jgi:hypothetical protein
MITSLAADAPKNQPLFLARLMMWRLYAWGNSVVQDSFDQIMDAKDVLQRLEQVRPATSVTTSYGGRFSANTPTDAAALTRIWNHGVTVWSRWILQPWPMSFSDSQRDIKGNNVPCYSGGDQSRLLLYGDLARLEIITSPSLTEMGDLIWKANTGALKGLRILGWEGDQSSVEHAIFGLLDAVNASVSSSTKDLLHNRSAGVFDIEHALCKVSSKQRLKKSRIDVWVDTRVEKRAAAGPPESSSLGKKRRHKH